jgi:hypothetical protein
MMSRRDYRILWGTIALLFLLNFLNSVRFRVEIDDLERRIQALEEEHEGGK